MSIPVLRRLLKVRPANSLTLVVRNLMIAKLVKESLRAEIPVVVRHDGRPWSQVRMWIALRRLGAAKICAPMLSGKLMHRVFFSLLPTVTYVPATFCSKPSRKFRKVSFSLESFSGHQVNYFVRFTKEAVPELFDAEVDFSELILAEGAEAGRQSKNEGHLEIAIGLSCSGNERHKIPSVDWFVHLLVRLTHLIPVKYLLMGDQNDLQALQRVQEELGQHTACEIVIDTPVADLINRLSLCALGISGTTGQGHMMAAAGLPILVLAGVTSPEESGPYAQRVAVVRHNFPCGPCYQESYRQGCGQIACMDSLDNEVASDLVIGLINDVEFGRNWLFSTKARPVPPNNIAKIHSDMSGRNSSVTSRGLL